MATRKSAFDEAREAFDELRVEEKARFMVEAVFSTLTEGIDRLSDAISDGFEDIVEERDDDSEGEAAAPKKKSAASKKRSSTKRKSARKSTAKKRTRKSSGDKGDS